MGRDTLEWNERRRRTVVQTYPLNSFEEEVLRVLDGEDVPGWSWGAAMAVCCENLKRLGYAKGCYEISDAGKAYLERTRNEGNVQAN